MGERPPSEAAQACLEDLRHYKEYCDREIERVRSNLNSLSEDDKASLVKKPEEQVKAMREGVEANMQLLDQLAKLLREEGAAADAEASSKEETSAARFKAVQVLLQTFVREWSAEGMEERSSGFSRLLGTLESHRASKEKETGSKAVMRVAVTANSLGRLAFEVSCRGFSCEACDGHALNWYGTELIRKCSDEPERLRPQPFVLCTLNRLKYADNHRVAAMPDLSIKEGSLPYQRYGDFTTLYAVAEAKDSFDALVTSFAIDLSPSAFRFVRIAAHVVKPGGLWTNFGPMSYEARVERDRADQGTFGLELSWEELKYAMSHFFDVEEEEWVNAFLAQNSRSLMQTQLTCIYFKAVRNTTPAPPI
eukprot:TRINITY_DN8723_c0_g2_i1.p1 TRINITY_DN8723_c0_g2~~TRINITY_DN8723_c0_g2_i1.p1  ORF type:complete len:364 (+),score=92.89 TRINITY_DN8723_c0_g2_i1:75-1166(+)